MTQKPLPPHIAQRLAEASMLRESGKVPEAITAYRAVLADAPNLPDSWYNLGWLLRRADDPNAAIAAYDRALALNINGPEEVFLNKGVIFADDLLDPAKAQEAYRAALAINPRYGHARFNLANTLEDLGDRKGAALEYRTLLQQAPGEPEPLARLANLSKISSPDDALVVQLQAALARTDLPAIARASLEFALGRLFDQAGAYDRAFAAFRNANAQSLASRESEAAWLRSRPPGCADRFAHLPAASCASRSRQRWFAVARIRPRPVPVRFDFA